MSTTKKITINVASAIFQVVFTALMYFFLYRYLLNTIGVEKLGVWSLILSFSSIANLANLGITSGLVKFVAEYLAAKEEYKIGRLILTSSLALTVFFSVLSVLILFCAKFFMHYVVAENFIDLSLTMLPYSLSSLCINALSGVFTSVLEGFQKNYIRNIIYIFSGVVMFVFTLILVPKYNIEGVAISQLIQSAFVFFSSLLFVIYINPYNRIRFWRWSFITFKEIFNYGYKFQVVSICQLLCEPTTKLLLSRFGGMSVLGYYEMAAKLVNQVRALLVNANQVVVPIIADSVVTKTKNEFVLFFKKMNQLLFLFTSTIFCFFFVSAAFISYIWIGHVNNDFIFSLTVLIVGTGFNVMNGPVYFTCLGEGRLSILVVSHIGLALINVFLGYFMGLFFGGYGVIVAWSIAMTLTAIYLINSYGKISGIKFFSLFSLNEKYILLITVFIVILSSIIFSLTFVNTYLKFIIPIVLLSFYIPFLKRNEILRELLLRVIVKKNN